MVLITRFTFEFYFLKNQEKIYPINMIKRYILIIVIQIKVIQFK